LTAYRIDTLKLQLSLQWCIGIHLRRSKI